MSGGVLLVLAVVLVVLVGDDGPQDAAGGDVLSAADGMTTSRPALTPAPDRVRPEAAPHASAGAAPVATTGPAATVLPASDEAADTGPFVIKKGDGQPMPLSGGQPGQLAAPGGFSLQSPGEDSPGGQALPTQGYHRPSAVPKGSLRSAAPPPAPTTDGTSGAHPR